MCVCVYIVHLPACWSISGHSGELCNAGSAFACWVFCGTTFSHFAKRHHRGAVIIFATAPLSTNVAASLLYGAHKYSAGAASQHYAAAAAATTTKVHSLVVHCVRVHHHPIRCVWHAHYIAVRDAVNSFYASDASSSASLK